jgi:Icc-related predicted phosphoesterase
MRLLASADVHGRLAVYEWLLTVARQQNVDAIVLAGDLLGCLDGFETPEDAQRYDARTVANSLETAGVPVLYMMGNDDLVELDARSPRLQSIHGCRVALGPFRSLTRGGTDGRPRVRDRPLVTTANTPVEPT